MFPMAPEITRQKDKINRVFRFLYFNNRLNQKIKKETKRIRVSVNNNFPYFPKISKPKAKPLFSMKKILNQGKMDIDSPSSRFDFVKYFEN